jgi:hypothetical protein
MANAGADTDRSIAERELRLGTQQDDLFVRRELSGIRRQLARAEHACGCPEGALAAFIAVLLYAVAVIWPAHQLGLFSLTIRAAGAIGVLFLAGGIGKVVGLIWARRRVQLLRNRLRQLEDSSIGVHR